MYCKNMERTNFALAPKRRRRPVTKSSLGCTECKSRKIKCDETRPTCLKCRQRGNVCSGVATGLKIRWSTKHENVHHRKPNFSRKESEMNNILGDVCSILESAQSKAQEAAPAEIESLSKDKDESTTLDESQIYEADCTEPAPTENNRNSEITQQNSAVSNIRQLPFPMGCPSDAQLAFEQAESWPEESDQSQSDESPEIEFNYLSHFESEFPFDLMFLEQEQSSWGEAMSPISSESESPEFAVPSPSKTHDQTSANEYHQKILGAGIVENQSGLITIYFTIVCPIFSTFDSEHNLFRSFVGSKWQHSATIFYSILSMAAAKLSRGLPSMKREALEYQNQAIVNLQKDVTRASYWNEELLFAVLMLGLSTSWHVVTDLGIPHLRALQRAVSEPSFQQNCNNQILRFVKQALVYWEMVICSVNDDVITHDNLIPDISDIYSSSEHDNQTILPIPATFEKPSSIMPHPWAGVAVAPQALFAQVCHRIRQARSYRHIASTGDYVNGCSKDFLDDLNRLEKQTWLLKLPALHEIANTGDRNTPAIHHLLLAEAYMFATMYQLYRIFPRLRKYRLSLLQRVSLDKSLAQDSWAFDQARSWPLSIHSSWSREGWVEFLGLNTILRLEQIQETSGTCCVHALLLLVGSGSLAVSPELELNSQQVFRTRRFVLDRLSQVSASKLSEPISLVELVVLEIFRRLDLGLDVFWMDTIDAMGVITVIG